jgi:caffeoyl-CoA O-methyltransferase
MKTVIDPNCMAYAVSHTSVLPGVLRELEQETLRATSAPEMLCGPLEGRFLKLLVQLVNARCVLELGLFTGYSALNMAEGLGVDGRLVSCEMDPKMAQFAQRFFDRSPHGHKISIRVGPALDSIASLDPEMVFDLVFVDAEKSQYRDYLERILPKVRSGGLIVVDNTLLSGGVFDPQDQRGQRMHAFNQWVLAIQGIEVVFLPIRDGISLIRKK